MHADETIDFDNTDPVELLSAYVEAHREAINEMQQRERAAAEKSALPDRTQNPPCISARNVIHWEHIKTQEENL